MADWITARADEIRRIKKEKKDDSDRQAEAASILKQKIAPFWDDLTSLLQQSTDDFNAEFPDADRRIDAFEKQPSTGVTIRRAAYPAVAVKAQLNGPGTAVNFTISHTHRKGTQPTEKQASFSFGIVAGEVAYVAGGVNSHEDVAKLFLEPFFEF